eukprot:1161575-Pelagomonas_calceolata.AAC.17
MPAHALHAMLSPHGFAHAHARFGDMYHFAVQSWPTTWVRAAARPPPFFFCTCGPAGGQAGGLQLHELLQHLCPLTMQTRHVQLCNPFLSKHACPQATKQGDKDVPAPVSARRPTGVAAINRPGAGKETAAAAAGVVGNAQQQQQQQQQRRMYPGPPPLRVPGSQPAHMDQGPFGQERDAMPVKDSKMQNWRDGLIKEMASKRQGGFRPPPGAAAAATAK